MSDADSALSDLLEALAPFASQAAPAGSTPLEVSGDHLNAERFLGEHGNDVRYSPEMRRWFVWNGSWWQEDSLDLVHDLARQTIDGLRLWAAEATDDEFQRRAKHYANSARSARLEGMLAIAGCHRQIVVGVGDLDQHPHLLTCPNGTVDLRNGGLLPAERNHLITRGVEIHYDPDALSARWLAFLNRIFGDDAELISFVQRLFGYALTGEVSDHALAIFYGDGANGKSQLIAAVMAVMAGHAVPAPDGLLVQSRSGPHEERIAILRGRRLVVSSELEDRSVMAEALVKLLTGGDQLTARHMYGHRFQFKPSHTLLLVTNHLPSVSGTDTGIWRRLKVVPFEVVIPPADQIPDYGRQLADQDGPAILAWLVQGAVDFYRIGLSEPESVRDATRSYQAHEDVFGQFLEEETIVITGRTPVKDLLAAWRSWSSSKGVRVGRTQQFSLQLKQHDIVTESFQHAQFARGIGLPQAPSEEVREVS